MLVEEARDLLKRAKDSRVDRDIMDAIAECETCVYIREDILSEDKKNELIENGFAVTKDDGDFLISWE